MGWIAKGFTGRGPRVVIIGDSLTLEGLDDLYNSLDGHYAVEIGAWFGEGYDGGPFTTGAHFRRPVLKGIADSFAPSHPAIAVLAIGTNDAWEAHPVAPALAYMKAIVSEMGSGCLVGVTIPAHSTAQGWSTAVAERLNAATRTWANQIVDWAALSRQPGVLKADGVHTTPVGTKVRSDAIAKAVQDCKKHSGST